MTDMLSAGVLESGEEPRFFHDHPASRAASRPLGISVWDDEFTERLGPHDPDAVSWLERGIRMNQGIEQIQIGPSEEIPSSGSSRLRD